MKKSHEEKIDIMRKYLGDICNCKTYYVKGNVPSYKIDNAIKKYAFNLDRNTIIGFVDTSIYDNGKTGCIFSDDKVYCYDTFQKPIKFWYDDIKTLRITEVKNKDNDSCLEITFYDGNKINIDCTYFNKTPLMEFLEIMKEINSVDETTKQFLFKKSKEHVNMEPGGYEYGVFKIVNNQYEEEKFHARQGHGFAAERANTLYDKLTGHDAKIVGDDNMKNGADRVVDGVYVQSKYCQTGTKCINECFESGGKGDFKYTINGNPMQIEVPSDKYDEALKAMEEKIRNGQVKGVTDPKEAKNIVRKGHFTYAQVKNIAKAGTLESLTYDAVNGSIIAASSFGISALITFATSLWNGEDFNYSIKFAAYTGLKTGGSAFITSVLASQLSKAGLNSALVNSSEAIVSLMGTKASAILINAFRGGLKPIYGAAALKSAAKLLRSNVITTGLSFVVLSSFDVANLFKGRISGKQLFKNMSETAMTIGGGTGGWLAGASVGSMIVPGAGTVIGGLIGSLAVGTLSGKATNIVVSKFIEDDADEMVDIIQDVFKTMATEYLLNNKEAEKCVDKLRDELNGKHLKKMFASSDRKEYARNMLEPIITKEVSKRKFVHDISEEDMLNGIKIVLEEVSDIIEREGYQT